MSLSQKRVMFCGVCLLLKTADKIATWRFERMRVLKTISRRVQLRQRIRGSFTRRPRRACKAATRQGFDINVQSE